MENVFNNYYDASEKRSNKPVPTGWFASHISKMTVKRDVVIKNKWMANIYNFYIEISDEAKHREYDIEQEDGTVQVGSGSEFVGRTVRSNGIFNFIAKGDYPVNSGGNDKYLEFCEVIGVECPDMELEVNGEKRTVKVLPEIDESDVLGKAVNVFIDTGKPYTNNDGIEVTPRIVRTFSEWANGETKDIEAPLPF
jgi:hypothetical protein